MDNALRIQLDFFIQENEALRRENEAIKALLNKHFDIQTAATEMIDKTLAETHGR
jgi:regulator of replication initiation timing